MGSIAALQEWYARLSQTTTNISSQFSANSHHLPVYTPTGVLITFFINDLCS